ncbi:hypothetical protein [Streptomyces sp. NPDC051016]|uniref:hypothetical protein n=1 Tax=Streptomyces sp. NPDC051016 TaxID=3365638 RepID=UPI003792E698
MAARFTLRTGDDLRRISRELRRIDDPELKKRFRKELRKSAAPFVPLIRNSIRQIPSKRPYTPAGLRGRLSKATRIETRTVGKDAGVAIRVDGRRMPDGEKRLPSLMEGAGVRRGRRVDTRWRHPVFGNREVWVQQDSHPYFFRVVDGAGAAGRVAAARVVDSITRDIR